MCARSIVALGLVGVGFIACTNEAATGPQPVTDGPGFFDRAWPDDRRMVDGHPDLSDFPGLDEYELVASYAATADILDGFGTSSPLYQQFAAPLDLAELPDAATSRTARGILMG